jgi:regulator of protease activity HflC (stomatin/prohibitin superfamily)
LSNQNESNGGNGGMETGTNPTRTDGGRSPSELRIEIVLNPATKMVTISENTGDSVLFYGIMEQAKQIYSVRQAEKQQSQLATPRRPLVLPRRGGN